jgi:hypothetical protein
MSSKQCFKCLQLKPLEAFYRHAAMRDGRLNKCVECTKADVRENRLAKIEHYRQFDRLRSNLPHRIAARAAYRKTDAFRLSHAIATKRWDVANAIRKAAQTAVSNAVRDGKVTPLPCFVCGAKGQAHHPDYSAPLAVAWLCPRHHAQTHREHREYIRSAAMTHLFDLAAEARALRERLTDLELDDQTIADTLEGETGELTTRATNIVAVAMELDASAAAIKEAEQRMAARRKAIEHRAERLRAFVRDAMSLASIKEIRCPYFVARLAENPPSVVVDRDDQVPAEFLRTKTTTEPDRVAIKAALQAGQDVPGARLVRTIGLRVR